MSAEKKQRKSRKPKPGLFDDLLDLATHEIEEQLSDFRASIRALEQEHESLKNERASTITLVQSMRGIVQQSRGMSKERQKLLNQFRSFRDAGRKMREERDVINSRVPPPIEVIEQRLEQTLSRLTTHQNDLARMPNQKFEIRLFSFFFELQAMYAVKKMSHDKHLSYIESIRAQEGSLKALDNLAEEKKKVEVEQAAEMPASSEMKADHKEIRRLNDSIATMLDSIKNQRNEIRKMRREVGRLDAYMRIRAKDEKAGRRRVRLSEVKQRASAGDTLSMEDLGALLANGNLTDISSEAEESEAEERERVKPRKRIVGASRGRPRSVSPKDRDKPR